MSVVETLWAPDAGDSATVAVAATLVVVVVASTWFFIAQQRKQKSSLVDASFRALPHAFSPIPFLGHGPSYFSGPFPFSRSLHEKYGSICTGTVFGKKWLFCFDPQDQAAILRAPERRVSQLKPVMSMAGFAFPQERMEDYPTTDIMMSISFQSGMGVSNVPHIVHSVRKEKRLAWVPSLRALLTNSFNQLPDEGTVSLFDWCSQLITGITVRVLLGNVVEKDSELLDTFVRLFYEGDPEAGFAGPIKSFGTLLETTVLGERRVFPKFRQLLDPYVESEIQRICVEEQPEASGESVLQSFIRTWYKKLNKDVELLRLAKRRILNELFLFTFAAFTNSYAGTAWLLYHVLRNTAGCGDKIRQEVRELQSLMEQNHFDHEEKKEGEGSMNDLNCPWLEWTLMEVSRLYTPGNLLRETMVDFKLPSSGVVVPAGTVLNISVGLAHRDPDSFPDPLNFDPLRHAPGGSSKRSSANPNPLIYTFGAGAHPCPGRKFAVYEMALFAAEALHQFDLTLEEVPPTDDFTLSAVGKQQQEQDVHHPRLDPSQVGFIWRSVDPVMVRYRRKKR